MSDDFLSAREIVVYSFTILLYTISSGSKCGFNHHFYNKGMADCLSNGCDNPIGITSGQLLPSLYKNKCRCFINIYTYIVRNWNFVSICLSLEFYLHSPYLGLWKTLRDTNQEVLAIRSIARLGE